MVSGLDLLSDWFVSEFGSFRIGFSASQDKDGFGFLRLGFKGSIHLVFRDLVF